MTAQQQKTKRTPQQEHARQPKTKLKTACNQIKPEADAIERNTALQCAAVSLHEFTPEDGQLGQNT
jgi:hypothetical protein